MSLKVRINFNNIICLLPFILIMGGGTLMNSNKELGSYFKFTAFGIMILYVFYKNKLNKNLILSTLLFIPFLIYGIIISFNINAGISDGLRYLFPIIILFYSYSIKNKFDILLKFVVIFLILNFITQIFNYVNWVRGVEQWFYRQRDGYTTYNSVSGILRGTGVVVFFGFFGFLNLISYLLIQKFYEGRFKKLFLLISIFGIFSSISYKTIGTFILLLVVYYYKYFIKILTIFLLSLILVLNFFKEKVIDFINNFYTRIQLYVTGSESARSESYRVMFEEIKSFNLFGKGVGLFGGPGSINFDSPYYDEVNFKWFDAGWLNLVTTDTYYPHLFVELGIIGAIMYLITLCVPLLRRNLDNKQIFVFVIYFVLFLDALFSFSLNNPEFLMFSLVFVYPILNQNNKND